MLSNGEQPWVRRGWSEDWTQGEGRTPPRTPQQRGSTNYEVSNDEVDRRKASQLKRVGDG